MRDLDSRLGSVSSLGGGGMGDHEEATATTQLDRGDDGTPAAGAPMPYDNTRSASSNGEDRAGGLRRGDIDKLEENAQTMTTGLGLRQEKVCVVGVCLILFSANAIVCHGTGVRSFLYYFSLCFLSHPIAKTSMRATKWTPAYDRDLSYSFVCANTKSQLLYLCACSRTKLAASRRGAVG